MAIKFISYSLVKNVLSSDEFQMRSKKWDSLNGNCMKLAEWRVRCLSQQVAYCMIAIIYIFTSVFCFTFDLLKWKI